MTAQLDVSQSDEFAMTGPPPANLTVVQSDEFIMVGATALVAGQVIEVGCAQVLITEVLGNLNYVGTVVNGGTIANAIPYDNSGDTFNYAPGDWALYDLTTTVPATHLRGKTVTGVADGVVLPQLEVVDGVVTLPFPAANVVVGLSYVSQLQTLRLDTGDPTVQGKRKNITDLSVIFDCSRGVVAGTDFINMDPFPDLVLDSPYTVPGTLVSDILRIPLPGTWNVDGVVCLQQSFPLPCTILGVVPELVLGDTGR